MGSVEHILWNTSMGAPLISPLAKNEHYIWQAQAREFDAYRIVVILYQKVKPNNHGHIMVEF